jgi:oxamate amidohydrolase
MVLARLIDFEETPASAPAGRASCSVRRSRTGRDSLKIESDVGAATRADLAARGHELSPIEHQSPLAGLAGVIRIDAVMEGAHESRGEGIAEAV